MQSLPVAAAALVGISCPSTADCWAVGGDGLLGHGIVLATTDGGEAWNTQTLPAGVSFLDGVSCPSVSNCSAVGRGQSGVTVVDTTDGGRTWNSAGLPREFGSANTQVHAIACPSASECWAVGAVGQRAAGAVIRSGDGGRTWANQRLPKGMGILDDISCAGTSDCWAVGTSQASNSGVVVATTDAGKRWSTQSVPGTIGSLNAISCADASDCRVTGGHLEPASRGGSAVAIFNGGPAVVLATTDGGRRWRPDALPRATTNVLGISCPATTACWTVGSSPSSLEILTLRATPSKASHLGHHRAGVRRRL